MDQTNSRPSLLSSMSPAQTFMFGIIEGILVLCTIGFFILLSLYLKGSVGFVSAKGNTYGPTVVNQPTDTLGGNTAPANISFKPVDEKSDHIRGAKNAKVTVIEYSDLECPFCKRFHETMQQVMEKYGKDTRWVYRHFPLESLHSQARSEANAAECAAEQGKFWEFADLIFATTQGNDSLDLTKVPDYARQAGVRDIAKFQNCWDTKKYDAVISATSQDAQNAGGQGTPYSVVVDANGKLIAPLNGALPLASVESIIVPALQ